MRGVRRAVRADSRTPDTGDGTSDEESDARGPTALDARDRGDRERADPAARDAPVHALASRSVAETARTGRQARAYVRVSDQRLGTVETSLRGFYGPRES